MCGNGREKKCIAEQSEGIAEHSVAVFGKEVQRHSSVEQSEKWQGHSIVRFSKARSGKGIAWQCNGQQRKGIDTLSLAWQCSARAEDREAMLRKGRGYIQRSRREGGAMGKEEICNMDCLHCVHPDCINERPMTRQARYYWRHRDRLLAEKREKYRRKKNELEGLPERKE